MEPRKRPYSLAFASRPSCPARARPVPMPTACRQPFTFLLPRIVRRIYLHLFLPIYFFYCVGYLHETDSRLVVKVTSGYLDIAQILGTS